MPKKTKKAKAESKKSCRRLPKDVRYMFREGKAAIKAGKCEDAMAAFDTLRTSNAKCSKHAAKSLRASFIRGCLRVKSTRRVAPIVVDDGAPRGRGWIREQQERAPMAPLYPGVEGYGGIPPTAKEWRGWQQAIRDARRDPMGGVTFNDNYNVATYGMTRARFLELQRAAEDKLGMDWREAKRSELSGLGAKWKDEQDYVDPDDDVYAVRPGRLWEQETDDEIEHKPARWEKEVDRLWNRSVRKAARR